MRIRVAILAASIGLLALAQTNLAQAALPGSGLDRQPSKLNVRASIAPLSAELAVARLASDALVKPREAVRMAATASCITGIGGGLYRMCTTYCLRYVDGVPILAPCLKAFQSVEDYVRKHTRAAGKH